MAPAVSIIVPAYNAETSLGRCLASITAQTFADYEVIIVDDGSSDDTLKIAEHFRTRDNRFTVIHQENLGVSAARQTAIDHVHGEYTLFVDSDDYIAPEMINLMYQSASKYNTDVVICDFMMVWEEKTEYWCQRPESFEREQMIGSLLYLCSLCNKLVRTSCYKTHNIRFDDKINASEDQLFMLKVFFHNDPIAVSYVDKPLYTYDHTKNGNSITNKGISASKRLLPLRLVRDMYDLSSIEGAFNNAILHIAYDYLRRPDLCSDYRADFWEFRKNIIKAKGFPTRTKMLVLLGLFGLRIPIDRIKAIIKPIP